MTERNINMHMFFRVLDPEERIIEGYASTRRQGRTDGLTIRPDAWRQGLADYMRSPVLLYQHGRDQVVGGNPVGQILTATPDDVGLRVRGQIAKGVDYVEERIWPLVQQGALRAFSVNAPLSSIKRVGNVVERIDLAEISIVSVPEDPGATFSLARAMDYGTDTVPDEIVATVDQLRAAGDGLLSARAQAAIQQAIDKLQRVVWSAQSDDKEATIAVAQEIAAKVLMEVTGMEKQEIEQMVRDGLKAGIAEMTPSLLGDVPKLVRSALDAERQSDEERRTAEAAVQERVDAGVKAELERRAKEQGRVSRAGLFDTADAAGPKGSGIVVGSAYDGMSAGDLSFMYELLRSHGKPPSDPQMFMRAMLTTAGRDMKAGHLRRDALGNAGQLLRTGDELMQDDLASYGDEWVPTLMSTTLWEKVRLDNRVMALLPQIELPSNPYTLPYEGADPTVYYMGSSADLANMSLTNPPITQSQAGTGNTSITARKLAALVLFNTELTEDSIIPILPQLRNQMSRALSDSCDNVIINGDTTNDNTNINAKSATPGTCPAGSKYLAFDGLRHLPLITSTGLGRDGATLAAGDFTANRALMSKYGIDPAKLVHIMDMGTYYKCLDISEVLTLDKLGAQATILNGQLATLGSVPIIVSAEVPLTGTDGKIDADTAGNNTQGSLLTVYRPGWVVGFRRQITIETQRIPFADAFYIVGSVRIGLARWVGTGIQVAALSYNVTV